MAYRRAAFCGVAGALPLRHGALRRQVVPHRVPHFTSTRPRPAHCTLPSLPDLPAFSLATSGMDILLHGIFAPLFAPLDACTPHAVRTLVWLDFRVAVALFVISPLYLFFGSLVRGYSSGVSDALTRVMAGYWQASALLLCAVLLHASDVPFAAFAGLLVQAVIAVSLNWWGDLLSEIDSSDGKLEGLFRAWRPVASVAAVVGVLVQMPFQGCNFLPSLSGDCNCVAWTEPPTRLFEILGGVDKAVLATLGDAGAAIYLGYLAYYVVVVLPRVGRSGRQERDVFTAVTLLNWLGLLAPEKGGKP